MTTDTEPRPGRPILWHYTCDHHVTTILVDGVVKPMGPPLFGVSLAWFTDLEVPHREALGLTMQLLTCDRTVHRFRVSARDDVVPYVRIRRELPAPLRVDLENAEGAMPMHWWVSPQPVPVVYSPGRTTYQGSEHP